MLPREAPMMQANTMMVASLGRKSKNMMRITTLGPPPPSPARELMPELKIISKAPITFLIVNMPAP